MIRGLILLVIDVALLLGLTFLPMFRTGEEDKGDGYASVLLPTPGKVNPWRTAVFFGMVLIAALFVVTIRTRVTTYYGDAVADFVNEVTGQPNLSKAWRQSVLALVPVLASLDIIVFSIVLKAPLIRRVATALNSLLLLALAISVDSLLLVVWHASGADIGPRSFVGMLVNIVLGTLVMFRVVMSSFLLPRPTAVRKGRRKRGVDSLLAFFAVAVAVSTVLLIQALWRAHAPHSLSLLAAFVAYPLTWLFIFVALLFIASHGPLPAIIDEQFPIDVIIPAYNESAGIHLTLRSIDAAAVRYGGPVRVILADDGSTDGTGDIARAEMAAFRGATGIVVPGQHLGKSAALNTALSYAETDIVVRIDADIIIDDGAFVPLATWFADPTIGSVGGMTYPRQDGTSWFHKMRLFECLTSYGFTRPAQARVDAVQCIPGTYTAMRRQPALELGGFVVGMNGEDADLTLQLGRMGYRIVIDSRIVVFEDVPPTLAEFREQRIRWNRAGTQVAARHSPFRVGFCGPRVWLTYFRMLTMRLTAVARPCVLTYIIAVAILSPSARADVLEVIGAYLFASVPILSVMVLLASRHRFAHRLPWLLCWWGFTMLRRVFVVEALLSLPIRPVRLPVLARADTAADGFTAPAIH